MEQIRRWFYRPKKDDKSLLAQFFYADEALNLIANELDSFDGRKDPERCTSLVNQLRQSQDKVLTITNAIMDALIGSERANRDFRVKFPEDVLQENLAGQLWFGAECLAAGSSIMNREAESTAMRPLAKAVTKSLENVRNLLRNTCLRNNTPNAPIKLDTNDLVTEMLLESLKIFDRLFADFELAYVSAMVPVKSTQEHELQELICVHFSETLQRALKMRLLTQDMVDDCDPALMFAIPRLAIVSGLLTYPNGPLCVDKSVDEMSEMFRPFKTLLCKIRELLWTLTRRELLMLEQLLCDNEQIADVRSVSDVNVNGGGYDGDDALGDEFCDDYPLCKHYLSKVDDPLCKHYLSKISCKYGAQNGQQVVGRVRDAAAAAAAGAGDGGRNGTSEAKCTNECSASAADIPSTSSYLIPNTVTNYKIISSARMPAESTDIDSPPDHDSLEVISVAAATLSSILSTTAEPALSTVTQNKSELESPNDSGISTENTSLDRSPSLDLNEAKPCGCEETTPSNPVSNLLHCTSCLKKTSTGSSPQKKKYTKENQLSPGTSKLVPKNVVPVRKKTKLVRVSEDATDKDDSSTTSSDTSSFNSNSTDDEEIVLAMQAAELACRNDIRSKYSSSEDLIHRLFVCIAGVADQLQTNFAADLRNILKAVFQVNASDSNETPSTTELNPSLESSIEYHPSENDVIENNEFSVDPNILAQEALFDTNVYFHLDTETSEPDDYTNHRRQSSDGMTIEHDVSRLTALRQDVANLGQPIPIDATNGSQTNHYTQNHQPIVEQPPVWIPDIEAPKCMSCGANFTVVKRRHHCRNCGKVFCSRCSSNSVPLPKFGLVKPVRVCNKCFIYNLNPFAM